MTPSSDGVGSSGWSKIVDFVSAIVSTLDIDSGFARAGLLRSVSNDTSVFACFDLTPINLYYKHVGIGLKWR